MSACRPFATERLCSPEGPKDWLKEAPLPPAVASKAGISFSKTLCGVE